MLPSSISRKESTKNNLQKSPNYEGEIAKLNRAIGQLEGVKKMIEEQRYCVEILQQSKASRSAIKNIEQNVLKKYIQMCLLKAAKNKNEEEILEKIEP
ncbi:MAG: metal-sensitive transcriptional regulator [Burkholderiales bacterium]|nr:metal-sensitive transcriptional regulator [Burkholderiales bacterium]